MAKWAQGANEIKGMAICVPHGSHSKGGKLGLLSSKAPLTHTCLLLLKLHWFSENNRAAVDDVHGWLDGHIGPKLGMHDRWVAS